VTPTHQCILQVEDDPNVVFLLERAFAHAGITNPVRVATDGKEAIDYLSAALAFDDVRNHPLPCLVLLDLKLPKLSGLEVLSWIRRQPGLRKLVVVLFSSSLAPAEVEMAYELGANSFVQKPADFRETAEIAQLLKRWWLGYNQFATMSESRPALRRAS
jgi:CheY-like chemotaxis protein